MISRTRLEQADRHAKKRTPISIAENWRRYRKVTAFCSGACCGNPRRHFGKVTIQERRLDGVGEEE